ncbi:MAG TPA: hypothetical protein IAC59_07840 [Candidatus Fimadaptatus faecigallinarum]|uniref:DUF11 domain-containing protein n=1 Tax=Candidatus Fimadaptatus faecigallinarum TaxID=2840814 RepID=A0A9D1LSH3_9FIRM|nr:hypothetical protein [Candidatus Fimadaptatus faecigallinarum]
MKKFFCSLLVLVLALAMALPAFAAGKLVVSDETMTVCESYSGYTAYIFAVLENTGDKPVEFNAGLIELLDADGESIDAEDYLYSYPTILDPGQKAYLKEYINVDDAESADYIDDYTLSVSGKSASENTNVALDCTAEVGMKPYSYTSSSEYLTATITVTNNLDETVREIYAAYALYDADGKVMYVDYVSPSYVGLPAGQTIELDSQIDSTLVEQWEKDGVEPASIEVIAYSRQGW